MSPTLQPEPMPRPERPDLDSMDVGRLDSFIETFDERMQQLVDFGFWQPEDMAEGAPAGRVLELLEEINKARQEADLNRVRILVGQVLDELDLEETLLYMADEPDGLAS